MFFPSWETPDNLLSLAVFHLAVVLQGWGEKMRNLAEIENPKAYAKKLASDPAFAKREARDQKLLKQPK